MTYEEKRMIFEIEAKRRGISLVRLTSNPEIYRSTVTRKLWEMFVRGMDIGGSMALNEPDFEEEVYKRYGTIQDNVQIVFKVRTYKGVQH